MQKLYSNNNKNDKIFTFLAKAKSQPKAKQRSYESHGDQTIENNITKIP